MSASSEGPELVALEVEVQAELELVETSGSADATVEPITEWLVDPMDIVREEVGLRSLLSAVRVLEGRPGNHPDGSR